MRTEVRVGSLVDFADGSLTGVDAGGHRLIVAREGDQVYAARNRCPHLGLPLTRGPGGLKYEDCVVQCPWHNSRFDVRDGRNLDWVTGFAGHRTPSWSHPVISFGRKPKGLDMLEASVRDGEVYVSVD